MLRTLPVLFDLRVTAVLAFFLLSISGADVWASECRTVRMVGHEDWPPISYLPADSHEMAGVSYDLARRIFGLMGVSVVVSAKTPWKRALRQLEHGEVDVITGATYSDERTKFGEFSKGYLQFRSVAVVRKGRDFRLDNLDDLIPFVGVMGHGDYHGPQFEDFARAHLTITRQSTVRNTLKMVLRKRADYAVLSEVNYRLQGTRHGFMDMTKALPMPIPGNGILIVNAGVKPVQ